VRRPENLARTAIRLTRGAAQAELREILEDEPDSKDVLRVVAVELDGRNVSAN
jgi:hypothetical protein